MSDNHAKFHSKNAFCGSAGREELEHLRDLISVLTDEELVELTNSVGIHFESGYDLERENYEMVIDEADREDFYREYKKILMNRKNN